MEQSDAETVGSEIISEIQELPKIDDIEKCYSAPAKPHGWVKVKKIRGNLLLL